MGFAQLNYSTSVILDMKTKSKEAQSEKTQFLRMLKLLNVICQPNCKSPRIYLHGNRTYAEKKIYEFMGQMILCIIHLKKLFRKIIV